MTRGPIDLTSVAVGGVTTEEGLRMEQEAIAGRMVRDGAAGPLPADSAARKDIPITRGVLDYFPAALAAVARVSKAGNDKHNPGEPMHHARGKSMDHPDCIVRHLMERGTEDPDTGELHEALVAWRALALCQEAYEQKRGAPLARGARV